MQIIVKNYAHINRSLPDWDCPNGRIVRSKKHYDDLCKEHGMVSFEQAEEMAANKKAKPYSISKESEDIIRSAKAIASKDGKVKLGDRAIDALIKRKAIGRQIPDYMKLPSHYDKGGFA